MPLYSLHCVTCYFAFFLGNALPSHEQVTGLFTPRRQSPNFCWSSVTDVKAGRVRNWKSWYSQQHSEVMKVRAGGTHKVWPQRHSHVTTGLQSCVSEATASGFRFWEGERTLCVKLVQLLTAPPSTPLIHYSIKSTMEGVLAFVHFTKYPLARWSSANR